MNPDHFEDIIIGSGVRETASEDGAVLLDIEQGFCFSLNPVGLAIWRMLEQHLSLDEMADSLEREFHAPRLDLVSDICDFVSQLEEKGLISYGTQANQNWLARMFS